jgi:hypothetical protein
VHVVLVFVALMRETGWRPCWGTKCVIVIINFQGMKRVIGVFWSWGLSWTLLGAGGGDTHGTHTAGLSFSHAGGARRFHFPNKVRSISIVSSDSLMLVGVQLHPVIT